MNAQPWRTSVLPAVPSLEDLATDPTRAAALPAEVRQALVLRALTVIGALAVAAAPVSASGMRPVADDRAVGLQEAASILHMTKDSLYRKWEQ